MIRKYMGILALAIRLFRIQLSEAQQEKDD